MLSQAVKSYRGTLLDSLYLHKPIGWKPDPVVARAALRKTLPGGVPTIGESNNAFEKLMSLDTLVYLVSNLKLFITSTAKYFDPNSKVCQGVLDPADDISTPAWSQPYVLNVINYFQVCCMKGASVGAARVLKTATHATL